MKFNCKILIYICAFNCCVACATNKNKGLDQKEQITFTKHLTEVGNARGVTVEEVKSGGYILTGYTIGDVNQKEDAFLIRVNQKGDILWKKTFGGTNQDYGWAVRQTSDNGFILVGYTNSFGNGAMDIYLIKTNSEGKNMWTKTFGGSKDEYGWDIRVTNDNGYIIAAQTNSKGKGEADAFLIKLDSQGNEEWTNTYGGAKTDRIFSVQQTPDGGYISAGISYSFSSINEADRDGYLLKTNAQGEQEWFKTIGEDKYDVAHSIALTKDGGYFIAGYGESYATAGNRDVYLIRTDEQGKQKWNKVLGNSGEERGIKGYQTIDEGFIAIGYTDKNRVMYLIRTNSNGDTLWTKTYGAIDSREFGYTVRETMDGGYILLGHSENAIGENSVLLIKTDSKGDVK